MLMRCLLCLRYGQACPWGCHSYGNPMGNVPWDGIGINCYGMGMGQIKVPWTSLGLSMGMSFLWEFHGKRPIGWDGTGINCYGLEWDR